MANHALRMDLSIVRSVTKGGNIIMMCRFRLLLVDVRVSIIGTNCRRVRPVTMIQGLDLFGHDNHPTESVLRAQ